MWISSREYRELYDKVKKAEQTKDDLIDILSEIVLQLGNGIVRIKSPARNGYTTINWHYEDDNQTLVINSKRYGIKENSITKEE